ncbi:MAG TPA: hypothetical protein V6D11_02800 [Waterburya sp.]|jgi:hypothetical protein
MKQKFPCLPKIVVRLISFFLISIALLSGITLNSGTSFQAQAAPLTPEATQYQVNSQDSPFREDDQEKVNALFQENKQPETTSETTKELGETLTKPQKTVKKNLQSAAKTTAEKLNLNQPPYTNLDEIAEDAVNSLKSNHD